MMGINSARPSAAAVSCAGGPTSSSADCSGSTLRLEAAACVRYSNARKTKRIQTHMNNPYEERSAIVGLAQKEAELFTYVSITRRVAMAKGKVTPSIDRPATPAM